MLPSEVYVVVPFSRPWMLQNVLGNYMRQRFVERKLVLVENGAAEGYCRVKGIVPDLLLTCEHNIGVARQVGLETVRDRAGYVAFMDDDDYYGPDYLTELVQYAHRGQVVAKANYFVHDMVEQQLRLFEWAGESQWVTLVHGATLGFWADEAEDFRPVRRWGEDLAWQARMRAKGHSLYSTSRYNYMCIRYGSGHHHSWPCNSRTMVKTCTGDVYNLGEVDLAVVNGRKPASTGIKIGEPRVATQGQECRL